MNKSLLTFKSLIIGFVMISGNAHSAIQKVNSDPLPLCDTTMAASKVIPATKTQCRNTPSAYKIKVFEMGVCTAHPYGAAKDDANFDTTVCEIGYKNAAPAAIDIGASIGGGASAMSGVSTLPKNGTYTHAYLVFGNEFTVKGQIIAADGTVYSSKAAGSGACLVDKGTAGFVPQECTESLGNFSGANCFSGYVGAPVTGGIIDGFIVNNTLVRGDGTSDVTAGECDLKNKLVGVMTLDASFSITPQTYGLNFNFNLTNQGIQWIEGGGPTGEANEFSSAPFSGSFEVLNQD